MDEPLVECLLHVSGDSAVLNTFDKQFRSGTGPRWADRPADESPHYSLHALFPVPEEIQRRGYETAGRTWCSDFWETPDDLTQMQVKRLLGERRYRFFTEKSAPGRVFWKASADYPTLHIGLALVSTEKHDYQRHLYHEGRYQASYVPHDAAEHFAALRKEMGFAA